MIVQCSEGENPIGIVFDMVRAKLMEEIASAAETGDASGLAIKADIRLSDSTWRLTTALELVKIEEDTP